MLQYCRGRVEASRREAKRRKLEAVHPEQILVRQARERLNRLIGSAANRLIGEVVQSRRMPLLGPSPG